MQSLVWTGRLVSRALWNSISNYSTNPDPIVNKKVEPHILSAVSGFPKNLSGSVIKRGKFGDDAWFTAKWRSSDVLGMFILFERICASLNLMIIFILDINNYARISCSISLFQD